MKIKKSWSIALASIGMAVLAGSVYAAVQNPWDSFTKKEGVVKDVGGEFLKVPGDKEKQEVANSIDPRSGQPTKKFDTQALDKDRAKKIVALEIDNKGNKQTLNLSYIDNGARKAFFSETGEAIYLLPVPQSNDYIIQFEEDLYLLKGNDIRIEKLLNDQSGKYNIHALYEESIDGIVPVWGTDPVVSPDGKRVAFYSSRNAIVEGDNFRNGQLWVKNLETGEEKAIYDEAFTVLGWGPNSVYVQHSESVIEINAETGEGNKLVDLVLHATVSYPYLLTQTEYGKADVLNLENSVVSPIVDPSLNRIGNVVKKDGSPWVMIFNYPNREDAERTLIVTDLSTQKTKTINEPDGYTFTDSQWTEEGQMLINVRNLKSSVEETYIVDLKDVE